MPEVTCLSEQDANDLANSTCWTQFDDPGTQFDDPVLGDLVDTALRQNHDLLIATARIEEFAGRYGIVRAELFPQVGAGYEASRQRNTLLGANSPSTYNNYQAVIAASWEVGLWGEFAASTKPPGHSCWAVKMPAEQSFCRWSAASPAPTSISATSIGSWNRQN